MNGVDFARIAWNMDVAPYGTAFDQYFIGVTATDDGEITSIRFHEHPGRRIIDFVKMCDGTWERVKWADLEVNLDSDGWADSSCYKGGFGESSP